MQGLALAIADRVTRYVLGTGQLDCHREAGNLGRGASGDLYQGSQIHYSADTYRVLAGGLDKYIFTAVEYTLYTTHRPSQDDEPRAPGAFLVAALASCAPNLV